VPAPDRPAVAYLVDPTAAAITLADAPGAVDPVLVPYGGTWPDPLAVHVVVRAGEGPPIVAAPGDPVSVELFMPRGRVQIVELSHAPDPTVINQFEAFGGLAKERRGELRRLVEQGRHHVISARTPLTLVHAVRVPVEAAGFSGAEPVIGRQAGRRVGTVSGGITLDRPSTERIVLIGDWTDPVDDLSLPAPTTRTYRADTAVVIDAEGAERTGVLEAATLDLVDTRRHTVTLQMDAFSRFSRYFTEQVDGFRIPSTADGAVLDARGVVPRSVHITAAGQGGELELGKDFTVDRDAGTVVQVSGGDTRPDIDHTVRYIPLPVSRSSVGEPLGTTTVVFPAAVRPVAPVVADVVPAAARRVTQNANRIEVDHDGRVLRVLLERPWWSSGEEERLAVLLDQNPPGVPERTRWGRDPLVAASGSLPTPTVGAFPAAAERVSEGGVDVAAHEVRFDEERGLWATDIVIDAELGERPFVQLALARYQPIAVEGLALSDEVQPDPVRLGSRRRVRAQRSVTAGDVVCRMDFAPGEHLVQVRVQQASADIADPDLRWSDVGGDDGPLVTTLAPATTGPTHRRVGEFTLPIVDADLRLVFEDFQPVTRTDAATGDGIADHEIVYRETIEIPPHWRV
jgi:hypothetical protein